MFFSQRRVKKNESVSNESSEPAVLASVPDTQDQPNSKSKTNTYPYHALLFAAFPILALYSRNMVDVQFHEILRPMLAAIAGTFLCWVIGGLITRNIWKGAFIASAAVTLFYACGHIYNLVPANLGSFVTPFCVLVFLCIALTVARTQKNLAQATRIANFAAVVLILPAIWTIVSTFTFKSQAAASTLKTPIASPVALTTTSPNKVAVKRTIPANRPDIYYIILDAYGRADSLKAFFGFDNKPFVQALRDRGFYLPPKTRSNYDQTGYSLASTLNMRYLNIGPDRLTDVGNLSEQLRKMIDESEVANNLRRYGYRYVSIWSGTGQTRVLTADVTLASSEWKPPASFSNQLEGLTLLGSAPSSQASEYDTHRGYMQSALRSLSTVAKLPSPKFVFTHIAAPHPPFVFGPNGEPVDPRGPFNDGDGNYLMDKLTKEQYATGYTNQVRYLNKRVLQAVDAILEQSKTRPIIIIQGDHGSRMTMNWFSVDKTDLREPFPILNAYYVPPKIRMQIYNNITPVNTFGIVFNTLFGENRPRLPDRSFYSPVNAPLNFVDVTDRIKEPPKEGSAIAAQISSSTSN